MVSHGKGIKDRISLRAISNHPSRFCWLSFHIIWVYCYLTTSWVDLVHQNLKSCWFSSSIYSKKSKAFTIFNSKGKIAHSCVMSSLACIFVFFSRLMHSDSHTFWRRFSNTVCFIQNIFVFLSLFSIYIQLSDFLRFSCFPTLIFCQSWFILDRCKQK